MPKDDLILQTKLQPPQIKGKVLRRDRLLNLLKENLEKKLILICADAGYGKTTLLVNMIEKIKKPYIWYTLETKDRSFVTFLRYLIAGIRKYLVSFGEELLGELRKPRHSTTSEDLLRFFLNELQLTPQVDFLIILDDYHNVSDSEEINNVMNYLLSYTSANLHFIISTRTNPFFVVSKIKTTADFFEISAEDMRFTYEETLSLCQNTWGLSFDKEQISTLWSKTKGWVVGLYLLITFLKSKKTIDLTAALAEVREDLYEYFTQELFLSQSKIIQEFLIKTSLLNILQENICNELLKIKNSAKILNQLVNSGLFTYYVDREQRVYQYHPLFREFLIANLGKVLCAKELSKLYYKAGRILEQYGNYFEALDLYIKTKNWKASTNLMLRVTKTEKNLSKIFQMVEYLNQFPLDYPAKDAKLLYVKALFYIYSGKYKDAILIMTQLEKKFEGKKHRRELLTIFRAMANAYIQIGYGKKGLIYADKALRLHQTAKEKADILCLAKGVGLLILRKYDKAETNFRKAYKIYEKLADLNGQAKALAHLGVVSSNRGNLLKATHYYESALRIFVVVDDFVNEGIISLNLASIYTEFGELERAEELTNRVIEISTKFNLIATRATALSMLGTLKCLKGDNTGYHLFDTAINIYKTIDNRFELTKILLAYCEARIIGKDLSGALALINNVGVYIKEFKDNNLFPRYRMSKGFVGCRLGYYSKAKKDINWALKECIAMKDYYNMFFGYLYLAYLFSKLGKEVFLLKNFDAALKLAKAHNYEMCFVTEQDISLPLLIFYFTRHPQSKFIQSILEKIGRGATKFLLPLISEKNILVSKATIELLTRIGDPEAIDVLRKYLGNESLREPINLALKCIPSKITSVFKICFFGKMEVWKDNVLIDDWKYKPAVYLFQLLLLKKGRHLHREEIMESLWPNLPLNKASTNFYTALSILRKILEPERAKFSRFSSVRLEKEYCWFVMKKEDWYDVEVFLKYCQTGKIKEKEDIEVCLEAYRKAREIYRGDLLTEEPFVDWIEQERKRLKEIYIEILFKTAFFMSQRGEYDQAIEFYKQILGLDPCNESVHRELIICYLKINNRSAAIEQYRICEDTLRQNLGFSLSAETKRLLETILS